MGNRLLRYEDYINNICQSLGCTWKDSIIGQLNKLKADAEKAKGALTKAAELEAAMDKTKDASSRITELHKKLDKSNAEIFVAQASIDRIKADKEIAIKELVDVKLQLAMEKSLRKKAEATITKWEPNYLLAGEKMNAVFDVISPHMETCRLFRDEIRPFLAKFEPEDLDAFDEETRSIDGGVTTNESTQVDKSLVSQSDELVDITVAERCDQQFLNPDDPSMMEIDYLLTFSKHFQPQYAWP